VGALPASLDALVADILGRHGYRFTVPEDEPGREAAYRLRYEAVVAAGWRPEGSLASGLERDRYDARAVHVVGWDADTPIATGRLVLPPDPLPTEDFCGIVVEPRGRVVDVGRLTVARRHQSHRHAVFVALLARLYLEMRARGYEVACGLMSARVRALVRQLGVRVEVLGDDRPYWGELRAPVRFTIAGSSEPLAARWQ